MGRPLASQTKKLKLAENTEKVHSLLEAGFSKAHIARTMGVQTITVCRFAYRMGWSQRKEKI